MQSFLLWVDVESGAGQISAPVGFSLFESMHTDTKRCLVRQSETQEEWERQSVFDSSLLFYHQTVTSVTAGNNSLIPVRLYLSLRAALTLSIVDHLTYTHTHTHRSSFQMFIDKLWTRFGQSTHTGPQYSAIWMGEWRSCPLPKPHRCFEPPIGLERDLGAQLIIWLLVSH